MAEADHAHVVAEVLAAELRADAEVAGQLQHALLEIGVAEPAAGGADPVVGSSSRYFAEAYFAVFRANSALVPPMTMGWGGGGQAAVPSERSFSSRKASMRSGFRTALVSW